MVRLRADKLAARAWPPFDAPSIDSATAAGFFSRPGGSGDRSMRSQMGSSATEPPSKLESLGLFIVLARACIPSTVCKSNTYCQAPIWGIPHGWNAQYRTCMPDKGSPLLMLFGIIRFRMLARARSCACSGMHGMIMAWARPMKPKPDRTRKRHYGHIQTRQLPCPESA